MAVCQRRLENMMHNKSDLKNHLDKEIKYCDGCVQPCDESPFNEDNQRFCRQMTLEELF
jgi:hypothetical protein